jgi:uncharacterized repeat protein (TIGR03803 family)
MRLLNIFAYASLGLAAAAPLAHAQSYTTSTIYQFCSLANCSDGYLPISGLIQGADGNFYGETEKGGTSGVGTIFKLSPAGTLTTLREAEEQYDSSLIQGGDGNYYYPSGGVDVLKMSSSGNVSVLESTDGTSTLIQGSDGNFYGIGGGGVIKITQSGGVSLIYQFCSPANCADGTDPNAPLLEGSDGNLYGTTSNGGANGYGSVFKLTKSGTLTTIHSFTSDAYGASSLVEGPDGNFYGLNSSGSYIGGNAFKISPSGTYTVVVDFCPDQTANQCLGYNVVEAPASGSLYVGSDGNFYGVGFDNFYIAIFGMSSTGALWLVSDLSEPGVPIQGSDGNFYGLDSYGGISASECANSNDENYGCGTVYKITASPALPAPVQVSLSSSQVQPGKPVTASLKVLNAFSLTMQQCYAFQNGTPLGKVPGTYNSSTKLYTFSGSLTPATAGIYNYAVTCGGVESGFATLTVGDTTQTTLAAAPNPVTPPANDTLTATVTRTTGSGTPTGSVTFSVGTTVLGKSTLNGSGVATLAASSSGVAAGTYPVVATYSGDANDISSASAALNVTVQ